MDGRRLFLFKPEIPENYIYKTEITNGNWKMCLF